VRIKYFLVMNLQSYQRQIIGYHGCDSKVAAAILRGESLKPSGNEYDWLGRGIYFWEYGPDRALAWAREKHKSPAVVGALINLGVCFDLLDTRHTEILTPAFDDYRVDLAKRGMKLPENSDDPEQLRRNRDCAFLNWMIETLDHAGTMRFQTVRGVFQEGGHAFPGSGIYVKSHIQVAVRDSACIIGYFRPSSPA